MHKDDISSPAAVILAAGESQRMGKPKMSLPFHGATFLDHLVNLFDATDCSPIILVLSSGSAIPESRIHDFKVAFNPHPEDGPLSSIKLALPHIPPHCPGLFIHPVDHPAVTAETIRILLNAWRGDSATAVKPVLEGRGGHPMLLGRDWIGRIRDLSPSSNLRELLRAFPDQVASQPVSDAGVLLNINSPDDYRHLLKLYSEN